MSLARQGLAWTLLSFGPAMAQGESAGVSCKASGYDVVIFNAGPQALDVGTEFSWAVPFVRKEGQYALTRPLEPDTSVFVSAALGSTYLATEKLCTIAFASSAEEGGS